MTHTNFHPDAALIDGLGDVAHVATLTNSKVHAVYKWRKRGIPARVKLYYPHLFIPAAQPAQAAPIAQSQGQKA